MSMNTNFAQPKTSLWEKLNWEPSSQQLQQFITLQKLLHYYNQKSNLTRLLEEDDYWIGHVFDSLWPFQTELKEIPQKSRNCIDVGTGCGFPGLAIAISLPETMVTLLDSTRRKTNALKKITAELDLNSRIQILTERVEITGQNNLYRGKFDLAMARAVANPPVTAEYLMPLLKKDGEAALFRGKWNETDQKSLNHALTSLKGTIKKIQRFDLPSNKGTRHLIRLEQKSPCPSIYPRPVGIPTKKPLGTMN